MPACRVCLTEDRPIDAAGRCPDCVGLPDQPEKPKAKTVETPTEMPKFDSYEEMQEWVENQKGSPKKALTLGKSSGKKKAPADKDAASDLATVETKSLVWQTVHIYTRKGDSWSQVSKDAKKEGEYRAENVLVFGHDHEYGQNCTNNCRRFSNG